MRPEINSGLTGRSLKQQPADNHSYPIFFCPITIVRGHHKWGEVRTIPKDHLSARSINLRVYVIFFF